MFGVVCDYVEINPKSQVGADVPSVLEDYPIKV
jgi:hypothetical protein